MSLPQNLITVHPSCSRALLTSLSRSIFLSILANQNFLLVLWSDFLTSQSLPCQNSPSQKMAILLDLKTKSGLPITVLQFLRYLRPEAHINLPNMISMDVPEALLALILRLRCSGVSLSISSQIFRSKNTINFPHIPVYYKKITLSHIVSAVHNQKQTKETCFLIHNTHGTFVHRYVLVNLPYVYSLLLILTSIYASAIYTLLAVFGGIKPSISAIARKKLSTFQILTEQIPPYGLLVSE